MTAQLRRRATGDDELGTADLLAWLGTDPGVRANMVTSVDGRATVGGRVGPLTGAADQALVAALRGWCDALLVGAGTIRAEGYGTVDLPDEVVAIRAGRGQPGRPVVAILSGHHDLEPALPVFAEAAPGERPWLIIAEGSDHAGADRFARVVEVAAGPDGRPGVAAALDALHAAGMARVLSEGGPTALGHLLGQRLVHELFLTVSPVVVGGDGLRLVHVPAYPTPVALTLRDVLSADSAVFLRYAVVAAAGGPDDDPSTAGPTG